MKKIISLYCIRLVIIWLWLAACNSAYAIDIDPMRLELELDSGKVHTDYITVTNHSKNPVEISASTQKYRFIASPHMIYPEAEALRRLQSCQRWIEMDIDRITIGPESSEELAYTIYVPENSFGEHVAAIVIDENTEAPPLDPGKKGQVRIKITPRISIPVYVAIKGYSEISAKIENFDVDQDIKKGIAIFEITLKNTSTKHIRPVGTIIITDSTGQTITRLSTGRCLPVFSGYGEKIPVLWEDAQKGKYTAIVTLDIGAKEFLQEKLEFELVEFELE